MARKHRKTDKPTADTGGSLARLPPVFPAEITGRDRDGDLLAKPLDWTDGERPSLIVHTRPAWATM
jgi:hypothetical protein